MYYSGEDKIRHRLKSFARKNLICRIIAAPVRGFFEFCFMTGRIVSGNIKKIGVSLISLLLFPVLSSFSFSAVNENDTADWTIDFDILDESVFIADRPEETADELLEKAEEVKDQEERELEVAIAESGEISKDDLYLAEDLINRYLDETDSGEEISIDERDYRNTYDDYEFDPDDWKLILINKSHFIPEDYEVPLGTIYGIHQCDERIIPDLVAMLRAAREDGVNLSIRSPYRTSALQILLYNNKISKFMDAGMSYLEAYKLAGQAVTIPGASEHEAGLSLDIVSDTYTSLTEGFGETAAGKWLASNAHYYGFILRYPAEKEYITTIEYEPWHFRYVGVPAATVMYNEGLTLEEFWEKYLE